MKRKEKILQQLIAQYTLLELSTDKTIFRLSEALVVRIRGGYEGGNSTCQNGTCGGGNGTCTNGTCQPWGSGADGQCTNANCPGPGNSMCPPNLTC